jgi:hypothetical protein
MSLRRETDQLRRRVQRLPSLNTGPELPFPEWLYEISPSYVWDWPYLRFIIRDLENMTSGELTRMMIFLHTRHGKSSLVTERLYRLQVGY